MSAEEFTCRLRGAAVCIWNEKLLLVRHERPTAPEPYWVPPGGGVMGGETLQAAALRELREETGYGGEVIGVFGFREVFKPAGTVFEVFFRVRLLADAPESPRCEPGKVLREARWFAAVELPVLRVYPEAIAEWVSDPDRWSVGLGSLAMPPVTVANPPR